MYVVETRDKVKARLIQMQIPFLKQPGEFSDGKWQIWNNYTEQGMAAYTNDPSTVLEQQEDSGSDTNTDIELHRDDADDDSVGKPESSKDGCSTTTKTDMSPPLVSGQTETATMTTPPFTSITTKRDKKFARQARQRDRMNEDYATTTILGYSTVRTDKPETHRMHPDEIQSSLDILRESMSQEERTALDTPTRTSQISTDNRTVTKPHPIPQYPPQPPRIQSNPYTTPTPANERNRNAAILSHHLQDFLTIFDQRQQEWLCIIQERERDLLRLREESIRSVEREARRIKETIRTESIARNRHWEAEARIRFSNQIADDIQDAETLFYARMKEVVQSDLQEKLETELERWMTKNADKVTTAFDRQYDGATKKYQTKIDGHTELALQELYSNQDSFATQAKRIQEELFYQRPQVDPNSPTTLQNHIPADEPTDHSQDTQQNSEGTEKPTPNPRPTRWQNVDYASILRGTNANGDTERHQDKPVPKDDIEWRHQPEYHRGTRSDERERYRYNPQSETDRNDQQHNWNVNETRLNQLRSAQTNVQLRGRDDVSSLIWVTVTTFTLFRFFILRVLWAASFAFRIFVSFARAIFTFCCSSSLASIFAAFAYASFLLSSWPLFWVAMEQASGHSGRGPDQAERLS